MTPEAHAYMTKGELIPEGVVFGTLLSHIFHPNQNNGIGMIVDGKFTHLNNLICLFRISKNRYSSESMVRGYPYRACKLGGFTQIAV